MVDKISMCEKIVNKNLPLVRLDEKLFSYTDIVEDLNQSKDYFDIKGIRINMQPLIKGIKEHAIEWRNTLGRLLAERTTQSLLDLKDHINVYVIFLIYLSFFC